MLKKSAHDKVWAAKKVGKLVAPERCSNCGSLGRLQCHHKDYTRPLDVTWLCATCHRNIHVQQGARFWRTKLTQFQVDEIRHRYKSRQLGPTQEELAKEYGVSTKCIYRIISFRSWKGVRD